MCSWGEPGPTLPLQTAQVRLAQWPPKDPLQVHLGLLPTQLPPGPAQEVEWRDGCSKTEPGTF